MAESTLTVNYDLFVLNAQHIRRLRRTTIVLEPRLPRRGASNTNTTSNPETSTAMVAWQSARDWSAIAWFAKLGSAARIRRYSTVVTV